jgi:hypothetical protein
MKKQDMETRHNAVQIAFEISKGKERDLVCMGVDV